ncbi:hypothetical protein J7E51_04400 [Priestia megaterium]|nr:hypothetical protein [Priestia megaterium]
MTNLTNQIHLYQLGTEAFYSNKEWAIHTKKMKMHKIDKKCKKKGYYKLNSYHKQYVESKIKQYQTELKELFNKNKGSYRKLRVNDVLKNSNVVSMFESALSRAIEAKTNELTTDIIIVECFYEEVLEDILVQGFDWNGHWILFSASAGQTRQKKAMMIRESKWKEVEKELMCGLTIDDINAKGSMNISKLLAYKALANSATTLWNDFDINRCIVVDDMEVTVHGDLDYINTETYEIERKENHPVQIEITDGCGMILPTESDKNFMFRAPFFKGLLSPFNFRDERFMTDGKLIVNDIYNEPHDLIAEDIKIIFTRSQFKLHSFFTDWNDYKEKFKANSCTAGKLNEEDDEEQDNKRLNYQMLQTLHSMTDSELETIASETIKEISLIGKDTDVMLNVLGANDPKTPLQHALSIYPELLQDPYANQQIKDKKKYLVKDARAGKLKIESSYTFVIPDLYAFCNWLFVDKSEVKGLLNDGEVFCKQYGNQELNLLRSPHLYIEHCLRQNVIDDKKKDWFTTNGIYTSAQDLYSKLIMCDWDGDKILICADKTILSVAKRQIEQDNVVPLYYEMAKAKPAHIDDESICKTLMLAYQANIGLISNLISKIWNQDEPDIELIKLLVMESNHEIDFAKTLYKPTRPPHIEEKIEKYEHKRLPHFFKYAKNKKHVAKQNNGVVNRLESIIQNKRIHFEVLGMKKFDAKFLIGDTSNRIDSKLAQQVIEKYRQLNGDKFKSIKNAKGVVENKEISSYVNKQIREELIKVGKSPKYVADILVKYLYWNENAYKSTLWNCFGYEIVNTLRKTKVCEDCSRRFKPTKQRQVRCDECQKKHAKKLAKERKRKQREKEKMSR